MAGDWVNNETRVHLPNEAAPDIIKKTAYVKFGLLIPMTLFAAQLELLKSRLFPTKTSMPAVTEGVEVT